MLPLLPLATLLLELALLPPLLLLPLVKTLVTVPFPLASDVGAAPGAVTPPGPARPEAGFVGLNGGFVDPIEVEVSFDFSPITFEPLTLIVPAPGTVTGFLAPIGADVGVGVGGVAEFPGTFDEVNRTLPALGFEGPMAMLTPVLTFCFTAATISAADSPIGSGDPFGVADAAADASSVVSDC